MPNAMWLCVKFWQDFHVQHEFANPNSSSHMLNCRRFWNWTFQEKEGTAAAAEATAAVNSCFPAITWLPNELILTLLSSI